MSVNSDLSEENAPLLPVSKWQDQERELPVEEPEPVMPVDAPDKKKIEVVRQP